MRRTWLTACNFVFYKSYRLHTTPLYTSQLFYTKSTSKKELSFEQSVLLDAQKELERREKKDKPVKFKIGEEEKKKAADLRSQLFASTMKEMREAFKDGDSDRALQIYEEKVIPNRLHIPFDDYISFLKVLTKDCRVNRTFEVYNKMKKERLKPNVEVFSILMTCCSRGKGKGNYVEKAEKILYTDMPRWNVKPTTFIYNEFLKTCALQKADEAAMKAFEEMKKNEVKPDIFTYTTLMKLFAKNGKVKQAFKIFDQMEEEFKPDAFVYNALMTSCKNGEEYDLTFEVYRKMVEDGVRPTSHTFSILLGNCRAMRDFAKVLLVYKEMKAQNVPGDEPLLNNMAVGLATGGYIEEAVGLLRTMRLKMMDITSDTFHSVLKKSIKPFRNYKPNFETVNKILIQMAEENVKPNLDELLEILLNNPQEWRLIAPILQFCNEHLNLKPKKETVQNIRRTIKYVPLLEQINKELN